MSPRPHDLKTTPCDPSRPDWLRADAQPGWFLIDTVRVPLTQGAVAIIDSDDAELVMQFKWCLVRTSDGPRYARNGSRCNEKLLHRFILDAPKGVAVDHVNGNGLDNRRCNLRLATTQQNAMNRGKMSSNTSGFKGVSWVKRTKKWRAYITVDNKQFHLGYFISAIDAAIAYDRAAADMHGEYARLNFTAVPSGQQL